jgi:putative sigma-54 modulation protein
LFVQAETHMKIHITSRHEQLSEGLRVHIEGKIHKVERYLGKIKEAHVVLNFEKRLHICEVVLTAKRLQISARASSRDMYKSIDAALDRLEKQAQKQKEKWADHHRWPEKQRLTAVSHSLIPSRFEGDGGLKVIHIRKFAVKPMTAEEAAMQLISSRDEFLVFSNAETDQTSVVYKRKDNQIGLIEPEY